MINVTKQEQEQELIWVGDSKEELKTFPDDVKDMFGYALHCAQGGGKHIDAKPLKGDKFTGKGIFEVVESHDGDTYRAVYTVKIANRIYVLHAFKKKSHKGIKTPKHEIDLILKRFKIAELIEKDLSCYRS